MANIDPRHIIKNLPARFSEYINDYRYTVARECPDGNWYYGVYNRSNKDKGRMHHNPKVMRHASPHESHHSPR